MFTGSRDGAMDIFEELFFCLSQLKMKVKKEAKAHCPFWSSLLTLGESYFLSYFMMSLYLSQELNL